MYKTLLTTCFLFIFIFTTYAQLTPFKKRAVGLSVGLQQFKVLDQHASPLTYSTNTVFPKVGLSFGRQTNRSAFDIELSGSMGQLMPEKYGSRTYKTTITGTDSFQYSLSSPFMHTNLKASYLKNLHPVSSSNLSYWAGGVLNESAYYGDAVANMPWLLNTADLSPAMHVHYNSYSQHSLGVKFDFAVVGLITRATYSLFAKSNKNKNVAAYVKQGTRVVSLNKFRKANLQLYYQYQVSRHFALGTAYSIRWMQISEPKRLRAIDKNLDLKFLYTY
jgi:hypothetical protein